MSDSVRWDSVRLSWVSLHTSAHHTVGPYHTRNIPHWCRTSMSAPCLKVNYTVCHKASLGLILTQPGEQVMKMVCSLWNVFLIVPFELRVLNIKALSWICKINGKNKIHLRKLCWKMDWLSISLMTCCHFLCLLAVYQSHYLAWDNSSRQRGHYSKLHSWSLLVNCS